MLLLLLLLFSQEYLESCVVHVMEQAVAPIFSNEYFFRAGWDVIVAKFNLRQSTRRVEPEDLGQVREVAESVQSKEKPGHAGPSCGPVSHAKQVGSRSGWSGVVNFCHSLQLDTTCTLSQLHLS